MITMFCLQCGKEFEVTPSRKDTAKFCSYGCKNVFQSTNSIGEGNSHWKGGKIIQICKICGGEFVSYRSQNRIFCSRECYMIKKSEDMMGDNNISKRDDVRKKLSDGQKGELSYWFGRSRHPKTKQRISDGLRRHYDSMDDPGEEIVGHHTIYDHSDLTKNIMPMTRSMHGKIHASFRNHGIDIPHINIKEDL